MRVNVGGIDMDFFDKNTSLEKLKEKNARIPGTADWIKKNLNRSNEKVAYYKELIMKKAAR
jgi:hypothetical protein